MIPREKYGIHITQYKHDISTAKKTARSFKAMSNSFILTAILCALCYIAPFTYLPQTVQEFLLELIYVAIFTVPVALLIRKALKSRKFAKEIANVDAEESEFSKINCTYVSPMRLWILYYFDILENRGTKVQAFRLTADTGEEYVLVLNKPIPYRAACEIAYENKELTGTLYVRRYKGTNLLCEIKKEI